MNRSRVICFSVFGLAAILLTGCATGRSAYYSVWEKMGYEKRDILVSRVEKGRDAQDSAKKQFTTTMEEFKSITAFNGGDLEDKYNKLNSAYNECETRATAVSDKISSIDKVAQDLFAEWNKELGEYQNADLRKDSEQKLEATKARYALLIAAMRKSEGTMKPVLGAFHDQVLFLKHNLNAQAIASLQTTASQIDTDVQKLIANMEASINEANTFINQMKS